MSSTTPVKRFSDTKREFTECLESAFVKLMDIWDDLGIVDEVREARKEVVMLHLTNLLGEMVREEEAMKTRVLENIDKYLKELSRLTRELNRPDYKAVGLTVLQVEKECRILVEQLSAEKLQRTEQLRVLGHSDQLLCDMLCATPYYIPTGTVPTDNQLRELHEHVKHLEIEKDKRQTVFRTTKQNIVRLLKEMELSPNTSFERDVVCEEDDSFILSSENMKQLKNYNDLLETRQKENFLLADKLRSQIQTLWDRLDQPREQCQAFVTKYSGYKPKTIQALQEELVRCKLAKIHNLRKFIELARKDLRTWWDKCYYTSQQREAFRPFISDEFTEQTLEAHEQEVARLQDYYEQNRDVLEKIAKREEMWAEFLEFERKASDPTRLFLNRGCNLLKEEKYRNKLLKELPKLEQEVGAAIEEWEKKSNVRFLMGGRKYGDYIREQVREYNVNKELEKQQRQQQRVKKTEQEVKYGSKPATPSVKRGQPHTTPMKSSVAKMRKLDDDVHQKPLSEVNKVEGAMACGGGTTGSSSDDNMFSQTTVSSGEIQTCDPDSTLAPVVAYKDFALTLNENVRSNCRSSVMPKPSYY